jgi:hypothetical protein
MPDELQRIVSDIYEETRHLYRSVQGELTRLHIDHGFRILYGPAVLEPHTLMVGFQPGGDAGHIRPQEIEGSAPSNEYLSRSWPLAVKLRRRFGDQFLKTALGTNAIFFRSPSVSAWRSINEPLREKLEAYCFRQTERIVRAVRPRRILILGWDTVALMRVTGWREFVASGGRGQRKRLLERGVLFQTTAFAMFHPTADWKAPPVTEDEWNRSLRRS